MSFAEWDHRYETGIKAVDEEHRQIVELINDFHDLLVRDSSRAEVIDLLSVVHTNIKSHFVAEEDLMRSMVYPNYRIHKADHDRLLEEITQISLNCEAGKYFNKPLALAERVKNWFDTHFFDMDGKLYSLEHPAKADVSLP